VELNTKPGITSNGAVPGFVLLCLFPQQFKDYRKGIHNSVGIGTNVFLQTPQRHF